MNNDNSVTSGKTMGISLSVNSKTYGSNDKHLYKTLALGIGAPAVLCSLASAAISGGGLIQAALGICLVGVVGSAIAITQPEVFTKILGMVFQTTQSDEASSATLTKVEPDSSSPSEIKKEAQPDVATPSEVQIEGEQKAPHEQV